MKRKRQKREIIHTDALHLRLPEPVKIEVAAIAKAENRDKSETMRCLLKLGVDVYKMKGTLFVEVDKLDEVATTEELEQEQRDLINHLERFIRKVMPKKGKVAKSGLQIERRLDGNT